MVPVAIAQMIAPNASISSWHSRGGGDGGAPMVIAMIMNVMSGEVTSECDYQVEQVIIMGERDSDRSIAAACGSPSVRDSGD